ncbi:MAG: class I tRNA ligase family protein, partial [Candidatus Saganbacteria bacterium]|nr:class I tRNA ligase family protein [Candidatus Saganbacteria bacterium]
PVWYCKCGEVIVSETTPGKCPECGNSKLEQDPDVFDTWFSSALWPFSTLGWPENTEDLKKYYPTSVLVTGYDIITFWVSRMIMMGIHFMKKEPFHKVFIHGLVRDVTGKKMSKSIGNVIDPLDVINHTGADSLRFALISLITGQGQDIKLTENKIMECRNFVNKIWNVSRFVLMNLGTEGSRDQGIKGEELNLAEQWILSKYNSTIKKVTGLIETFEIGEGARVLYDFIWRDLCDWYVEFSKLDSNRPTTKKVLLKVLEGTLRLLHPYMPFISEEIWQKLSPSKKSIMLADWPKVEEEFISQEAEEKVDLVKEVIRRVRNIRAEMNVPASKESELILLAPEEQLAILRQGEFYIGRLARSKPLFVSKLETKPTQAASAVVGSVQIYVPLAGLIDFEKEKERLEESKNKLIADLERIEKRLSNPQYLSKAEPEKVEEDREQALCLKQEFTLLTERISSLAA